jgi:hypothetical protein
MVGDFFEAFADSCGKNDGFHGLNADRLVLEAMEHFSVSFSSRPRNASSTSRSGSSSISAK